MASPSSLERDVSINELLAKHTGRDLLREMPRILLLRFPDRMLQRSSVPQESVLLSLPTETVVMIFEALPTCVRLDFAITCKQLAWIATENDCLVSDPATTTLLQYLSLSTLSKTENWDTDPQRLHMWFGGLAPDACGFCIWDVVSFKDGALTRDCLPPIHLAAYQLEIPLTKGMLWHLAYELVRSALKRGSNSNSMSYLSSPVSDMSNILNNDAERLIRRAVEHCEGHMSKIVSDTLRHESYGHLRWKTPSIQRDMKEAPSEDWPAGLARDGWETHVKSETPAVEEG